MLNYVPLNEKSVERWRISYRLRPYLQNCTEEELSDRLEHCFANGLTLLPSGAVGWEKPETGGALWMEKFSQLLLECERRRIDIATLSSHERLGPASRQAQSVDTAKLISRNQELFNFNELRNIYCKFGQAQWINALVNRGDLRLSPASHYNSPGLGAARYDDELRIRTEITPYDHDLGLIPSNLSEQFPTRRWRTIQYLKPSDHYIYCVTCLFDFRYFIDFQTSAGPADCCAIISNQGEFEARMINAVRMALPTWEISFECAKYIDPFTVITLLAKEPKVLFPIKELRFMYQREFRLIATPPKSLTALPKLDFLNICIGPLHDIARIVTLKT
jgi:hypothetical protein